MLRGACTGRISKDILGCLLKTVHCGEVDLWSDTLWPVLTCVNEFLVGIAGNKKTHSELSLANMDVD